MRHGIISALALGALSCTCAFAQPSSWREVDFNSIPSDFTNHVIWGWEGPMDIKTIRHDLDSIKTKGFNAVIFEAGYNLPYEYLSEDWFKGIRKGVQEARKRGLKVWIIDEGKYPSGFAGGKFSKERPELRMQALVVKDTVRLADGRDSLVVGPAFRTGQTRAVNNPSGGKDTTNSLCDYLSEEAVRQFIDWTHEQYKKYIGNEFGKTVLGFRGDEPDFSYTPWTPAMKEEFEARKGYDPTPWLPSLFSQAPTVKERRFKADYWDVWSALFADNFFGQQAEWCEENGLQHITHLNNDHNMPVCVRAEGSLFRALSRVQIPGVDAIWNQIWPGTVNDFPKFASSVSHVYGKQRAFSESFAAYYTSPSIPQAKYVADYQMVRGINFFEYMFWLAGSKRANWMTDPGMKDFNDYTNRATYLLAQGAPGARIAVYYPTSTLWLGDNAVNPDLLETAQLLLRHQRDFDWVDDDAFTEALEVKSGSFVNKSGQEYRTLIIPSCDVLTEKAFAVIRKFAESGGKVLFWGRKPTMLAGRTFMDPKPVPDTPEWLQEPSVSWTATVEDAMPEAEMRLVLPPRPRTVRRPAPDDRTPEAPATDFIRYTRRSLPAGDLYFIFNEGEKNCEFTAEFDRAGAVRILDATDGSTREIQADTADGRTRLSLSLAPWESVFLTIE